MLRSFRPTITAHDIVLTGRFAALEPWWHRYDEADHARAEGLLEEAGMARVSGRTFDVLSEGERQQVLLARALMGAPELVAPRRARRRPRLGARERLVSRLAALAADRRTPRRWCWSPTTSRRSPRRRPTSRFCARVGCVAPGRRSRC